MKIKGILYEDFINYKKPSMTILFPKCSFKCDKECGSSVCQNSALAKRATVEATAQDIADKYIMNPFTSAIVCSGLEPFDSFEDLLVLIHTLRKETNDDIIIYTGYNEDEIKTLVYQLALYKNIYIKFGRFIPGQEKHFDEILGVNLASDNQYGKKVS